MIKKYGIFTINGIGKVTFRSLFGYKNTIEEAEQVLSNLEDDESYYTILPIYIPK